VDVSSSAQTATATRSFSPSPVEAGDQLVVTIAVNNYGGTGQLTETFPDGFSFVESSPSVTPSGRTLTFNLVGDNSVSYTLTAPTAAGSKTGFSGTLAPATGDGVDVGGPSSVKCWRPFLGGRLVVRTDCDGHQVVLPLPGGGRRPTGRDDSR
jgi:hypothetical protein